MHTACILIVDDDPKVRSLMRRSLEPEGFEVDEAADEPDLLARMAERRYDLITLDLGLRGTDGLEIARRLRRTSDTPIIMVTGKGDVIDRVVGLEVGADDYLVKPFHVREFVARVRTVLRRTIKPAEPAEETANEPGDPGYVIGELKLLVADRVLVGSDGEPISLTEGEFAILAALAQAQGRVLTREALILARGDDVDAFDRAIDSTVARLRKKLPPDTIATVRQVGYKIGVPTEPATFTKSPSGVRHILL
ncbi:DNA-binding response regulator [Acuticoccus sediminis]|uniref:DNA-binding response regulator n=1 Tax=Acuticoccus sediminis TaxID=2184697 RepID=A0A8B2P0Z8_9HYPH|nr:response regulator [Acuticoccus sediminis]RAI03826.1 DNA-binding response regulator [Acuticoccus sediminis]